MSLRKRMQVVSNGAGVRARYAKYGILDNPFPAAGQSSGHPRREDEIDDQVVYQIRQFETDNRSSQVLVIEGTQGVGKTNLLSYYERQFHDYYEEDETFYIIRYYPDPEPSFDSVLRKIFHSFDQSHFERIGTELARIDRDKRDQAKETARSHEVRIVLNSLERAGRNLERTGRNAETEALEECARLALEWFVGLRILKRHREVLGVNFRLDTVESRTQALRDVVYVSEKLDLLKGILLLLDELEKQDYSLSKTPVLRFLSAIRALIDALPRCLFLMLAVTPQARMRYFAMLPALAGRLQDTLTLSPVDDFDKAKKLYEFYVREARRNSRLDDRVENKRQGRVKLFDENEMDSMFEDLQNRSERRGTEGVTQRDFLHRLHAEWDKKIRGGST